MNIVKFLIIITTFTSFLCSEDIESLLINCPNYNYQQYQAIPYLKTVIALQEIGEDQALDSLALYSDDSDYLYQIIVLCRMLYEQRTGNEFRRPMIGKAIFFGDTDYEDWLLEPITILDGIPFLITRGYILGGLPESAASYLTYCSEQAKWRTDYYQLPTEDQLKEALNKILLSDKWNRELNEQEVQFFSEQIK